ncbi:MAG: response regulator [Chitinophagaceae bacterium]|nr:response regulator [Chitinophagaceae bacterium]
MIYLIDDKKDRQSKDYKWTEDRLKDYSSYLIPIYTLEEITQRSKEIFAEDNTILYHESFIDQTSLKEEAIDKRKKIEEFSKRKQNLLVYFSGSKSERVISDNIAYLPVSILYQNLEAFINQYTKGEADLKYLLYGENPEIEKEILKRLEDARDYTDDEESASITGKTLFLDFAEVEMTNPVNGADIFLLSRNSFNHFPDDFSESIQAAFKNNEYQHIFIPLCFGKSLSDYNGLRLATHIRCTEGLNQTANIYIYGVMKLAELMANPFFDILKTRNVFYVGISKKEFERIANQEKQKFAKEILSSEISKLNLKAPSNYDDNHAITNEVAIYQWSKLLGIEKNEELQKNFDIVKNNLYFKYLNTIHPIESTDQPSANDLEINTNSKPKILLIDDESSKGWYKIFASILGGSNGFWVDYLGDGFRNKTAEEIVGESLEKIKHEDIDIVILDFRLSTSDFAKENPNEMSSVKLIEKIKEYNPGIQIVGFSATNKIWNLKALQKAGVDTFIFKKIESKSQTIDDLITSIEICSNKAKKLKSFYRKAALIKQLALEYEDKFKTNTINNLDVAFSLFEISRDKPKYKNYVFIQLFLIIEEFVKLDSVFEEGVEFLVKNKEDVCVAQRKGNKMLTAITMTGNHKYEIQESNFKISNKWKRFDINFIVSSLLIFRLGNINSSIHNWSAIRNIRNTKVSHYDKENSDSFVDDDEIFMILSFLQYFLDIKNMNINNIDKGLKRRTLEESLKDLMADPRFKGKI